MMQLMGVDIECKCNVSIHYCLDLNNPKVWIDIGSKYKLETTEARLFWKSCDVNAVTLLSLLCYVSGPG